MGFYDAMKDAVNLAQKADNIELYRQLLDLSAQALDMQAEIARLTAENEELKKNQELKAKVIRHKEAYITLSDDKLSTPYCAVCYGNNGQFIQLLNYDKQTYFCCKCSIYIEKDL